MNILIFLFILFIVKAQYGLIRLLNLQYFLPIFKIIITNLITLTCNCNRLKQKNKTKIKFVYFFFFYIFITNLYLIHIKLSINHQLNILSFNIPNCNKFIMSTKQKIVKILHSVYILKQTVIIMFQCF